MSARRRRLPLATLLASAFLFRLGNATAALALPWLALSHTGDAGWAGAVAASGVLATILGATVGGHLIDRWGPAPVVWTAGVMGGLAVALIPVLHHASLLAPGVLVLLVALGAAFDAPGVTAQDSRLPELGRLAGLSVERVSTAKAFMTHGAQLTGPALAGAAIGLVGASPTLLFTAACSATAGLLAYRVLPRRKRTQRRPQHPSEVGTWAGVLHLWRDPLLRGLFVVVTLFSATVGGVSAIVLPALFQWADRPATDWGLFASALGAGGLAGIALHGVMGGRLPPRIALGQSFAATAAALLVLTRLPGTGVLLALGLGVGLLSGPVSPLFNTAIYARTPPSLRGRVLGALSALVMSAAPVAIFAMGLAVERWGPRLVLYAASACALCAAVLALRLPFGRPSGLTAQAQTQGET